MRFVRRAVELFIAGENMQTSHIAPRFLRVALALFVLCACLASAGAQRPQAEYRNPVIAGDYPDPSVIRVGEDYWATTTTGNWEPEFPLMHSRDLVNWVTEGAVFEKRPKWAARDFWAPEISQDRGRYFVYYTARKKNGPLCVAVATAARPNGPYTDHGPLVCQKDGSIDAAAVTDESGARYLLWKEDGNSRKQPTPIWAQKLSADGTKLSGPKKELLRNNVAWEGGVVEGPFILRRGDWFYLFYSGNSCCGRKCNYALGVARSRKLLGPWEKNPGNPILAENEAWQCPGHGSIVTDEAGRAFLLYHAYRKSETAFYIGREALLDEVKWGADNWPRINEGRGPTGRARAPLGVAEHEEDAGATIADEFNSQALQPQWRWPQTNKPLVRIETERGGRLILMPQEKYAKDMLGAVVTQPTTTDKYVATTVVDLNGMKQGALAGLSAYSWNEDALGIVAGDGKVSVFVREKNKQRMLATVSLATVSLTRAPSKESGNSARLLYLRLTATGGSQFRFAFGPDGRNWQSIGDEVNGSYLEPVSIALTTGGVSGASGKFEWIRLTPSR
jgi:xylan 1,4-beta-xylosidase